MCQNGDFPEHMSDSVGSFYVLLFVIQFDWTLLQEVELLKGHLSLEGPM